MRLAVHIRLLLLGAALLWSGCGTDTDPSSPDGGHGTLPDAGTPVLEIGTGARTFEPLMDGQDVPIVAGPQGGYHVWGGFEGSGFDGQDATIEFVLVLDDEVVGSAAYLDNIPTVDGVLSYAGVAVVLRPGLLAEADGERMTLALRVTTRNDRVLEDSIEIVGICCE